jgi:heat-inducible transcriptional repressor
MISTRYILLLSMANIQNFELSDRQIQILKAIIDEYISTAEPVGSETLDKKYNLGVSPATIRNDMVRLTKIGLLKQTHTSSGRTPTPVALRYYVDNLMKSKDLSVAEEVAVKERVWDYRQQMDKFLREATRMLAEKTKTLAMTATKDGDIYYSGTANILDISELDDYEMAHQILTALDKIDFWWNLMDSQNEPLNILLGDEIGNQIGFADCSFVYAKFSTPHAIGAIGVIGPSRLNYPFIIPTVKYLGGLIGEFGNNW